jgi:transcriptional regulator of acetoin/glycerol metabolism
MILETRDNIPDIASSWEKFIATGKLDVNSVRPEIEESWKRCYDARVDPYDGVSHRILDRSAIRVLLETHKDFIDIAGYFMFKLYEFVKGSGFIVVLSDNRGCIMKVMGDYDILDNASQVNLIQGSIWVEEETGTNGIGTALILSKPFQVSGREHYCRKLHTWTCSAAPIFDAYGRIIGALQMSGPSYAAHLHTLGMIVAAVESIGDQINVRKQNRELSVLNDSLSNIFQTMSDGAIIIDQDGLIQQINPTAIRMLGENAIGHRIENFLGEDSPIDKVLSTGRVYSDGEIMLDTAMGHVHSLVTAKPIKNEKGHITGAVVFLNPINNMKKLVNRFGGAQATFNFKDIVGCHEKLLTAIRTAHKAASSVSNVLIEGESGTGKELFAQAIHNNSPRRRGPFLALNCAALPRDLIASELFGYSQGAFTGASPRGRPGRFEMASGGTLFLDEIGDMPLDQQVSLLRVLQEKKITRLGGDRVIPVDVRIICATNRNLQDEVRKGNFRQDLYYRLDVVLVCVPPLRDRRDDVLILFDYFLKKIGRKLNVDITFVEPEVKKCLVNYPWPGNVRELENIVEKIINVADEGRIYIEHLPAEITAEHSRSRPALPSQTLPSVKSGKKIKEVLAERERQVLLDLLAAYAGNITQVAKDMGVSRNTVYRKIQVHGISKIYNFD